MQNVNDNETPDIGKHILSILTIGMYQDPRMIYREYIQNSADQIDMLSDDEKRDNLRQTIVIAGLSPNCKTAGEATPRRAGAQMPVVVGLAALRHFRARLL